MRKKSTAIHMEIEGELSIFTAASVRERILESLDGGETVEVGLSKVSEIDCAGVQLMVAAKREAAMRNKLLSFIDYSPAVQDILGLCDLSEHFGAPVSIY